MANENDMTLAFSRSLDPDKFNIQVTFGPQSFARAFPHGSGDPADLGFDLMLSDLHAISVEAVARLVADFARAVQTALDAEAAEDAKNAAAMVFTTGATAPKET